jgi:hypothetical protein
VYDKLFEVRQFFKESLERLSGEELERFKDLYSIMTVDRGQMMAMDMMSPGRFVCFRDWINRDFYYMVDRDTLLKFLVLGMGGAAQNDPS